MAQAYDAQTVEFEELQQRHAAMTITHHSALQGVEQERAALNTQCAQALQEVALAREQLAALGGEIRVLQEHNSTLLSRLITGNK